MGVSTHSISAHAVLDRCEPSLSPHDILTEPVFTLRTTRRLTASSPQMHPGKGREGKGREGEGKTRPKAASITSGRSWARVMDGRFAASNEASR